MKITNYLTNNNKQLHDRDISYYSSIKANKQEHTISVTEALATIKSGKFKDAIGQVRSVYDTDPKQYAKLKEKLPAFTFAGLFPNGHKASDLKQHSGMICMDFDHMDERGNLSWIRSILENDPYTYSCFSSPSNHGYKVLVVADSIPETAEEHKAYVKQLETYYQETYAFTADSNCSDVGRLCFVSYDPDLYVNNSAQSYVIIPPETPGPAHNYLGSKMPDNNSCDYSSRPTFTPKNTPKKKIPNDLIESIMTKCMPKGKDGERRKCILLMARILKFDGGITRIQDYDYISLLRLWHKKAEPFISHKDFEEYCHEEFLDAYLRADTAPDACLESVFDMNTPIYEFVLNDDYTKEKEERIRLLNACAILAHKNRGTFYLGCNVSAKTLSIDPRTVHRLFDRFIQFEYIEILEKGDQGLKKNRKATKYKWIGPCLEESKTIPYSEYFEKYKP